MASAVPGESSPPLLLLVEDDPNDQWLLRRALSRVAPRIMTNVMPHGRAAIEYLAQFAAAGPVPGARRPFLTLSDIHLPRTSGWELLRWMKSFVGVGGIPVLLWTSLPNPEGAARAQEMGAERYFSKPRSLSGYSEIASFISQFLGD